MVVALVVAMDVVERVGVVAVPEDPPREVVDLWWEMVLALVGIGTGALEVMAIAPVMVVVLLLLPF